MSNTLFKEFHKVSDAEWKEKVINDLKGKSFDDTLVWTDENGIQHNPYYRKSNTEGDQKIEAIQRAQRKDNSWSIIEELDNKQDVIGKIIQEGIDINSIQLNDKEGFLVNGNFYKESGATILDELSFTISHLIETIDLLTSNGYTTEEVISSLEFRLGISNSYFLEISKFRAFRYLLSRVYDSIGINNEPKIVGISSKYYLSIYDMHTNLLRLSTQSMSAVIGGCNALYLEPFDLFGDSSSIGQRLSRNIQLILENESYFDNIVDPSSGSYYIESLTLELVEKAWERIQDIEEKGGLLQISKNEELNKILEQSRNKRTQIFDSSKSMIGVNKFKNSEGINGSYDGINLSKSLKV